MTTSPLAMVTVLISCIIGAFGALFLKKGSAHISLSVKSFLNQHLLVGIFCYGLGLAITIISLRFGDLSVLYPLSSTTYIWVTLLSKYQLHEKINALKIAGILSILLGVSFIGFGK